MKVVVDTNAIWGDHGLTNPSFVALAKQQQRCGYRVFLPEVTVQEHLKHIRKAADDLGRDVLRVAATYRSIIGRRFPRLSADKSADFHERRLRQRLKALGVQLAPLPKTPHRALVERAVAGRRPFHGEKQKGYHDVLVWETTLVVAAQPPVEDVILVSGDSGFGDSELHDDLRADLAARKITASVTLVKSLQQTVNSFVQPLIIKNRDAKKRITSGDLHGFAVVWLRTHLDAELAKWPFKRRDLGISRRPMMQGGWSQLSEVRDFAATDVRRAGSERLLVRLRVQAVGTFGFVETVPVLVPPNGMDWDFVDFEDLRTVEVELEWLLNTAKRVVESASVTAVKML